MYEYRSIYGNMLQEYSVNQIRALNAARDALLARLKTKEDALAYVKEVREKISGIFRMPSNRFIPPSELAGS